MDSFAQTGAAQEDLFDDFTNGEESMQTRAQDDLFGDDFTPAAPEELQEAATPPVQQGSIPARGRGSYPRGRGRGRGRGGYQSDQSQHHQGPRPTVPDTESSHPQPTQPESATPVGLLESRHAPKPEPIPAEDTASQSPADAPVDAPIAPKLTKPQSVRGDRLATGGTARTKLTEEELSARMESVRLKNASLEAAHARAQADAESFAERESEAAKKRQVERKDRQQMMGEREKNRQRKLKAVGGREWDSEKREEDFEDRGKAYGRGAHGGVVGTRGGGFGRRSIEEVESDGREYLYREERGRGRGGARGRGRGGAPSARQSVPQTEDFPSLATKPSTEKPDQGPTFDAVAAPKLSFPSKSRTGGDDILSADTGGKGGESWADIVEESRA